MLDRKALTNLLLCSLLHTVMAVPAIAKAGAPVAQALLAPAVDVAAWVEGARFERGHTAPVQRDPEGRNGRSIASALNSDEMELTHLIAGGDKNHQAFAHATKVVADQKPRLLAVPRSVPFANQPAKPDHVSLVVRINGDQSLSAIPAAVDLDMGQSLVVTRQSLAPRLTLESISLFVRDGAVLAVDAKGNRVRGLRSGKSEIIITAGGQMTAVAVRVGKEISHDSLASLTTPEELTDFSSSMPSGNLPRVDRASLLPSSRPPMSLEESKAKARTTLASEQQQNRLYAREEIDAGYKEVVLQLLDERSIPLKGVLFPAGGLTVNLIGTSYSGVTSSTGHLTIPNVPVRSRLMVAIDDPRGGYQAMIAEFATNDSGDGQLIQLPVLRAFTFENSATVAGVVQNVANGSLCATVYDDEGSIVEGATAVVDQESQGPIYYNRFGFLDRTLRATGPNGRFCFFNLEPGPLAVELSHQDHRNGLIPVGIFASRHVEEEFLLNEKGAIRTRLASMATVHEQLSSDSAVALQYRPIDMATLVPLGTEDSLRQVESSLVESYFPLMQHGNRVFAVAQMSEFEPTLYNYGELDATGVGAHVTPLIPRGFVEDMAIFAQVPVNVDLGTVIAEFGDIGGQTEGAVKLRLLDERGTLAGQGFYYGDRPLTKAIFFNVMPGKYLVMAESNDGYWLAADSVLVYNRTVSYLRTGARTRYR